MFISYSWDSEDHRRWVRNLATRLRADGIEVILDQWQTVPGDQLPVFMEASARNSDFVLLICTPKYKLRADERQGGVGYEGDIITSEVLIGGNQRKFIPVLRQGKWENSAPTWALGKYYIDLRYDPYSDNAYHDLLLTLKGQRSKPPPIGTNDHLPEHTASTKAGSITILTELVGSDLDGAQETISWHLPYHEQLAAIEKALREWVVINIVGSLGSGRTTLLKYVRKQLTSGIWSSSPDLPTIVFFVDAQDYVTEADSQGYDFLKFLSTQVNQQLRGLPELAAVATSAFSSANESYHRMIEDLNHIFADGRRVVILIDNFTRVLDGISNPPDFRGLDKLSRVAKYVLVTDSRALEEISPPLTQSSDFFRNLLTIRLRPLSASNANQFLLAKYTKYSRSYSKQLNRLDAEMFDFIQELAGGHIGLLDALLQRVFFDFCIDKRQDFIEAKVTRTTLNEEYLNALPEYDTVRIYLDHLIESADKLLNDRQRTWLVGLAAHKSTKRNHLHGLCSAELRLLNNMGFINSQYTLEIHGKLLQYRVLKDFRPTTSQQEARLLDLLIRDRPKTVLREELLIRTHVQSYNNLYTLMKRLRNAIERAPNSRYFVINFDRHIGGYYLDMPPSFDAFLREGQE